MVVVLMFMTWMVMGVFAHPDFMGMTRVRIFRVRLGMVVYMGVRM